MNKDNVIELIYSTIPYPNQITNLNTTLENEVRFIWRGNTFRVTLDLHVEEVEGSILSGSSAAILLEALLRTKNK